MQTQKRKVRRPNANDRASGILRNEIEGDVFELWIGISRLMARMHGPRQTFDAVTRHDARSPQQYAARRRYPIYEDRRTRT
jgi:hypothetical protein